MEVQSGCKLNLSLNPFNKTLTINEALFRLKAKKEHFPEALLDSMPSF
jgi:hypothetical protein